MSSSQQKKGPAAALFLGSICEDQLFPFPTFAKEEKETLSIVLASIEKFLKDKEEDFYEFDQKAELPESYIKELKQLGLFGFIIPEEYGGLGLGGKSYSRLMQQTAVFDGSTALTIGAHTSIGMKGLLLFGTDEQKQKYLPKLATGEMIAAFCLTEPGSGSDAASIKTRAEKREDGCWELNGEKIWVTNGPIANFFTVFAQTNEDISAFIVERNFQGVSNGPKEDKMGIRASATSSVILENVVVPSNCLLGEEGKGFKIAMEILNNGRTGLGGGCIGSMKKSIKVAVDHAKERKQFGKTISEFPLLREKISTMAMHCYAAESVVQVVGELIDRGIKDYYIEAAISKIMASEALWFVSNEALQIAGGNGYMKEYPYERIVRDARINLIFEGTNEILRMLIGLSGLKEVSLHLKEVQSSMENIFNHPLESIGVLSDYATTKIGRLTTLGTDEMNKVAPELSDLANIYEKYVPHFASHAERLLIKYKKEIIEQQIHVKRIAESAIALFAGICILSRVTSSIEKKGAEKCEPEIHIARIFTHCTKRIVNQSIRRLDRNEDDSIEKLAEFMFAQEGYIWDTI